MEHISKIKTTLTNPGEPWVCPACGGTKTVFSLQIVDSGRTDMYFPKFIPQIKESCASCGRYKRFAPQGEILIKRFNDRLKVIQLPAKGRDYYEG